MTLNHVKLNLPPFYKPTPTDIKQAKPEKCGFLSGKVFSETVPQAPLIIVAASEQFTGNKMADYTIMPEPGPYLLYVPEGNYSILAFADFNKNLICEKDEFVGKYKGLKSVSIKAGEVVGELDFEISEMNDKTVDLQIDLRTPFRQTNKSNSLENGRKIKLDDDMFSKKYGSMGLWSPSKFISEVGFNIYAVEKFQSNKIPILFIHGSGGTPKDWEFFVKKIDRIRYQPWFFYYPSGLRLKTVSDLLFRKLDNIYEENKFDTLHIAAHSMGGLIARSFINQYVSNRLPYNLKSLTCISTPWGGIERANLAPKKSFFKSPPAWKDLASGSEFMEKLHGTDLPSNLKFCLFFGYKRDNILLKGSDDGAVALKSQLAPVAQSEATRCFGFDEGHRSILYSEKVISRYMETLLSIDGFGS